MEGPAGSPTTPSRELLGNISMADPGLGFSFEGILTSEDCRRTACLVSASTALHPAARELGQLLGLHGSLRIVAERSADLVQPQREADVPCRLQTVRRPWRYPLARPFLHQRRCRARVAT